MAKTKKQKKKASAAKQKKRGARILVPVLLVAALGVASGYYLWHSNLYRDHFFPGTVINGADCGGKTAAEVEEMLRAQAEDYSLNLRFRSGEIDTLRKESIGYQYVSDGSVQNLLDAQEPLKWILYSLDRDGDEAHTFATETVFDRDRLRDALLSLPALDPNQMTAPENAEIALSDGRFVVTPETDGNQIDSDVVFEAACEAVETSRPELDVADLDRAYAKAKITSDDPALNAEADRLNRLISGSITFELPSGERTLDGTTLSTWLSVDENGNYSKDEEIWQQHIADYVAELAAEVNNIGAPHTIPATDLGEITVSGGEYGYEVDQFAEVAQIAEELESDEAVTRPLNYVQQEFSTENGGLGNKYIEIDLSRQHLWYYKDGGLFLESDIVSGTMTEARWTPPGIWYVQWITHDVILKGEKLPNGKYEYETPVKYWMPFAPGGIGMHDASWRGSFGGEIYVWDGSHGCINLPAGVAQTIYENLDYQTPVVTYYSQGYSLH